MPKYTKAPYSQYLKNLKTRYGDSSSTRYPNSNMNSLLSQREFKLALPMVLRDRAKGTGDIEKPQYECLEPMSVMMNCLRLNDYNQANCTKQTANFLECFQQYTTNYKKIIEEGKKGTITIKDGETKFPTKFIKKMMEKYKTPRKLDNGPDIPT